MKTQVKFHQATICLTLLATLMLASCGGNKAEESATSKPDTSTSPVSQANSGTAPDAKTPAGKTGTKAIPELATQLGVKPTAANTCPTNAPVKGNVTKNRGNIYHLAKKSPDYDKVKPDICFKDVATG